MIRQNLSLQPAVAKSKTVGDNFGMKLSEKHIISTILFLLLSMSLSLGENKPNIYLEFEKALDAEQSGDYAVAFEGYQKLAKQGYSVAQNNLAAMYAKGQGITQDHKEALKWYTRSANQGFDKAQFNLGYIFNFGRGVIQDEKEAIKWYTLSAEQGFAPAQYNLALMHYHGEGTIQDHKEAVKWYTLSAEQGFPSAQTSLGVMYHRGHGGLIKDVVYAHMWSNIASSNGDEEGEKHRDILTKEMTTSQIEKAQDLARECVKKNYKGC